MNAARDSEEKAFIQGEAVVINGVRYNHDELHKIPSHIKPGIKSNKDRVAFFGKEAFLSNLHPATLVVNGESYSSTEKYYQIKKAEHFHDDITATKMKVLNDPAQIMKLGKNVKNFKQEEWETECRDVMMTANMAKYSQNPALRQALLDTGDKEILESSRHDTYWGTGLGLRSKHALTSTDFQGKNHMGQLLVLVRDHMKAIVQQEETHQQTPVAEQDNDLIQAQPLNN